MKDEHLEEMETVRSVFLREIREHDKKLGCLLRDSNKAYLLCINIVAVGYGFQSSRDPVFRAGLIKCKYPEYPHLIDALSEYVDKTSAFSLYIHLVLWGAALKVMECESGIPRQVKSASEYVYMKLFKMFDEPPIVLLYFLTGLTCGCEIPQPELSTARKVGGGSRGRDDWGDIQAELERLVAGGATWKAARKAYALKPGAPSRSQLNRRFPDPANA